MVSHARYHKKEHEANYSLVNNTTKNLAIQQQRVVREEDLAEPGKESAPCRDGVEILE
jgi:hypothetical protein